MYIYIYMVSNPIKSNHQLPAAFNVDMDMRDAGTRPI